MTELTKIRCVGCEGDVSSLDKNEIEKLLLEIHDWQLSTDTKWISKKFTFKNFYKTMSFVNAIAWIANQENHHPDLEVGFNYCLVKFTTHAAQGLTKNDFICAAKVDQLDAIS